jgi:hypothetical protein
MSITCSFEPPGAQTLSSRPRRRARRGHHHPPAVHHRGFYRHADKEELLDNSPAGHVRWPQLDYEPHATPLGRNEQDGPADQPPTSGEALSGGG